MVLTCATCLNQTSQRRRMQIRLHPQMPKLSMWMRRLRRLLSRRRKNSAILRFLVPFSRMGACLQTLKTKTLSCVAWVFSVACALLRMTSVFPWISSRKRMGIIFPRTNSVRRNAKALEFASTPISTNCTPTPKTKAKAKTTTAASKRATESSLSCRRRSKSAAEPPRTDSGDFTTRERPVWNATGSRARGSLGSSWRVCRKRSLGRADTTLSWSAPALTNSTWI
mmetsp:Transcript_3763/g.9102  ORF Transcript_3763/g.9102 Transcript_3763/m.9102 type:complete len:225 (+) Transcript_3763:575-1249(+)